MSCFARVGRMAGVVAMAITMIGASGVARGQVRPGAAGATGDDQPAVSPFELQKLFDSYALVQAQQFLGIDGDLYSKFLPRFMALQGARQRGLQQRTRALNEIRRLGNDRESSDEQLKNALKVLQDIEERAGVETRKAADAVDQVLDLRQQARFRIFEEQMERRKLELVTIARQANRANNPNRPNNPNPGR